MKLSIAICALTAASASAFAPQLNNVQTSTSLNAMDRRAAFAQIGGAVAGIAAIPAIANADGAVSAATVTKARAIYGDRIAALKSAVASGDFGAIADEKSAFILFNSGAYPGAKNKPKLSAAIDGTNKIFAAIKSGDKAAVQKAYNDYVAANGIKALPEVSTSYGQSYASDYSYLARTKAASVYVR